MPACRRALLQYNSSRFRDCCCPLRVPCCHSSFISTERRQPRLINGGKNQGLSLVCRGSSMHKIEKTQQSSFCMHPRCLDPGAVRIHITTPPHAEFAQQHFGRLQLCDCLVIAPGRNSDQHRKRIKAILRVLMLRCWLLQIDGVRLCQRLFIMPVNVCRRTRRRVNR